MTAQIQRILCPIDFQEQSLAALDLAINLAIQNQAKLLLLNVAPLPLGEAEMSPVPLDPYPFREELSREALEKLAQQRVAGNAAYAVFVVCGDAATGIVKAVRHLGADLVVMGTHGRKGVSHLVLGSVAEHVVRESPAPVLTVPPVKEPSEAAAG